MSARPLSDQEAEEATAVECAELAWLAHREGTTFFNDMAGQLRQLYDGVARSKLQAPMNLAGIHSMERYSLDGEDENRPLQSWHASIWRSLAERIADFGSVAQKAHPA